MKNTILNLFYGAIIGIANIIPGVSGGTMALVLGFYQRLITAINNISARSIVVFIGVLRFRSDNFKKAREEFRRIDGFFLVSLTLGALAAVVALAKLMPYLLQHQHDPTYGFFFGLILISAWVPYQLIKRKSISVFIIILLAIVFIVLVTSVASGEKLLEKEQTKLRIEQEKAAGKSGGTAENGSRGLWFYGYIFLMGAAAISAMILPGVSGSLLLLIMGGYITVLEAVSRRDLVIIGLFALGCVIGIALFSRLINFLLKRFHDHTMGFLVGLVLGSLWMIWPFKTTAVVGEKTVYLSNMLPTAFGSNEIFTLGLCVVGMAIVTVLIRIENRKSAK